MGTAILRSHDCLKARFLPNEAFAIATSRVASRRNSNPNHCNYQNNLASSANQNRRRKRSPVADRDRRRSPAKTTTSTNLVMGQVKILKRGEKLSLENNNNNHNNNNRLAVRAEVGLDLLLGSTDRLGPDPLTVQKQIRVSDPSNGVYAGSAFVSSPHPSSVPVPGFLGRNGAATSDLRRLLRLDLE